MNDNTVCCQNVSATEPQRDPRRPVYKNIIVFRADDQWSPLQILRKFYILLVGEHSICSRKGTGGYGIRPYGFERCPKIRL